MNKAELASAVGVTSRTITTYEAGASPPSAETLEQLSRVLRFPRAFFFRAEPDVPTPEAASFRALTRMTASQRDEALAAGALAIEVSKWVDERFSLPSINIPALRHSDPESSAEAVREHWGLGARPAPNMVHLLEAHGVRVFSLHQRASEVDAFSVWRREVPFVFLNAGKTVERERFDAAHELGHLVLHRHGTLRVRSVEHEADRFASAFLMPRASVYPHAPRSPTVERLSKIKATWGVSVAALARRLLDLELITEWQHRSVHVELSERGYGRRGEPNPMMTRETSQVLSKVFASMKEEGISKSDVARSLGLHVADLEALVFGLVLLPGG